MSTEHQHITQAITELGEKRSVTTTRAIFNERGVKVVEKGVTVNSRLYERLMAHVLDQPIEECVTSLPAVTSLSLRASAEAAVEDLALFRRICADAKIRRLLLDAIGSIPLPRPIAFQLTLASEVRPDLFQHLVRTAVFAAWLAQTSTASRFDLTVAASAGLLHDIGMLHLDPVLLTPLGAISSPQRRQLYAHSKVSSTLIERHHVYPKEIWRAVMEHHEFLDGSGYPRNLSQESISPLGRILSLAELFTAIHSPERNASERRLWVLLRMNQHRYDPLLVERLLEKLEPDHSSLEEVMFRLSDPVQCLRDIGLTLASWPASLQHSPALNSNLRQGMMALNAQAAQLQRTLANVGATLEQLDQLGSEVHDEHLLGELTLFAREAAWQLRALARQVMRRWRQEAQNVYPEPVKNWLAQVEVIESNEQLWAPDHDRKAEPSDELGAEGVCHPAIPDVEPVKPDVEPATRKPDHNSADLLNARILIVEDDIVMRQFVANALIRMGVNEVKECVDGASALQQLGSFWPDVVLTDIHMEPMGGIEFVRRLREHFAMEFRQSRVIFMSADSSRETLEEALSLGTYGYIVKPPKLEILRAKIEHALKG